ncbi:hypothetical protein [Azospirillum sp. sgz302134]
MARCEYDTVLRLRLGPAEREYNARIQFRGGRWEANIDRLEICVSGEWISAPWALDLIEDSAPLFDELRAHAVGRLADARETARKQP